MKAEHRKELHTNALAAQVNRLIEGFKNKPNTQTLTIAIAALLVVGLFFGWRYFSRRTSATRSAMWVKLDAANSPADLDKLAQQNRGTLPARVARFQVARTQLLHGVQQLAASPEEHATALKQLEAASKEYERLADESKDMPLLAQEALMGAAKAKESLGDLDGALASYQKLQTTYPKSALGKEAAERVELLGKQRAQVQGFYKKLEQDLSAKE